MKKVKIPTTVIFQAKCQLCGRKIRGIDETTCRYQLINHIDNECKVASSMRRWEKAGIFKEVVEILSYEELEKELKKLINKYSFDKVKDTLDLIKEGDIK